MGDQADWDSMQETPPPFDRAAGIGGSDVAAILGISPFRSEWDVWLEKTRDPAWQPQPQTPAMRLGQLMEPLLADMYDAERDARVELHPEDDRTIWHPNGILYAHVDGRIWTPDGVGIFEAKVPRDSRDWANGVPMYYESQARSYLACVPDAPWLDMAVLFRDTAEFQIFRIERDDPLDNGIVRRVEEWWERRVVRGEAPPMDASPGASAYLAKKYPAPTTDDLLPYSAEFEQVVLACLDSVDVYKRHEANIDKLKNIIRDFMGEYPVAEGADWRVIFKRSKGAKTTAWKEVAATYRKMLEAAEKAGYSIAIAAGALGVEPTPVSLDAVESLFTSESAGSRPLLVKRIGSKEE